MMNIILDPNNRELSLLKYLYGYDSFWDGKLEAIKSILQGKDTLTLVLTGGGKSVVYTLPAVLKQARTNHCDWTFEIYNGGAG